MTTTIISPSIDEDLDALTNSHWQVCLVEKGDRWWGVRQDVPPPPSTSIHTWDINRPITIVGYQVFRDRQPCATNYFYQPERFHFPNGRIVFTLHLVLG